MTAVFVTCLKCERFMLGQRTPFGTIPQPHDCREGWKP